MTDTPRTPPSGSIAITGTTVGESDLATASAAAGNLGITLFDLYALMQNPDFPTPLSNDGEGNIVFTASDIATFKATMASAKTNGWIVSKPNYNSAPWSTLASTTAGIYPQPRAFVGLFD